MKNPVVYLSALLTALALLLLPVSCYKNNYTLTTSTTDSSTQIIMANDELNINYEFDQAVNEALLATSLSYIASGDTMSPGTGNVLYNTVSQAIIDTSRILDSSLIHVEYYGKNADGTKGRTGTVTALLSKDAGGHIIPWDRPGAVMTLLFEQYEVIVLATNVSLWINGTATITNVTGGQLTGQAAILLPADSLQDRVSAYLQFTYNDNTGQIVTYPWTLTQTRTFSIRNSLLTSTIRGDTTIGTTAGVSTSGTTRFSYPFYTQVTALVVQSISSSFLLSEPLSGQKVINGIPEPLSIVYGVNSSGSPVQGSPYGYSMSWTHSGTAEHTVVAY